MKHQRHDDADDARGDAIAAIRLALDGQHDEGIAVLRDSCPACVALVMLDLATVFVAALNHRDTGTGDTQLSDAGMFYATRKYRTTD